MKIIRVFSSIFHPLFSILIGLLCFTHQFSKAQSQSYWESIPENVRERNAFKRFEWFYRQRALPYDTIPEGALERARDLEIAKELMRSPEMKSTGVTWTSIGPTGVVSTWPSQWGNLSGRVRAIAVHPSDPNTVYIGAAAGGIWKTTDGGNSWQDVGFNLASLTFGAIAIDPNNPDIVYAGAGESMRFFNTVIYDGKGLYKSTNAGATWTHITNGFGTRTHFGALKVSPTNSNTIFAALGSGYWHSAFPGNEGLWRSTDAGLTWTRTLNVDDGFDVLPHPTIANRVYGATGGATSTAGFYISTDNGASWTQSNTGLPTATTIDRIQIALSPSSSSTLYAIIHNNSAGTIALYKSTNDGANWALSYSTSSYGNQAWYDLLVAVNPSNVNEVYIGDTELRRSTDGGSTFSYVGGTYWNQSMHVDFHYLVFAPSNPAYRYVGCDGGIYRSTNGGSTWIDLNSSLPTIQYYRITSHPTNQNIMIGGAQDNGIYKTTNGGVGTWTLVSTGDGMECFYDYNNPNIVYVSTQNGGLKKSTTGGDFGSYTNIKPSTGTQPWAWTAPFFIHPTNSSTIYAATDRPWRSTNGGSSWSALTSSAVTSVAINTMAQSPVNPNNMILAGSEYTNSPQVYVSTDEGSTWTNVTGNIGGTARYISRVVFHPNQANTVFIVRSGFSPGNKIYRSTNLGANWTNISGDLPDVPHNDLFINPLNTNEMFTANDLGVYRTTNGGTNWVRQGGNMPFVPVIDFDYFNSGGVRLLRAATHGRSAYQTSLAQTISVIVPNGSEVWTIGSNQSIQWSSNGITGNVKIELSRNGGSSYEILYANTSNDGSEIWPVTGPPTAQAKVKITSIDFPSVSDISDGNFSIVQPSITVTVPNGGETWQIGTDQVIQWNSSNVSGNVKVELSRNGGSSYEILYANTSNDGSEIWPVTGPPTAQAKIKITSIDFPSVSDESDGNFSIVLPSIMVTIPNGGETWQIGTDQIIQWTSSNVSGNVQIELSRNGGNTYEVLFASTENDDSVLWNVTPPMTMGARIRISSVDNSSIYDVSDENFTISDTVFSIDLSVLHKWNLISVPVIVNDFRKTTIFPTAISPAFAYDVVYIQKDTLQNGVGYWLKFLSAQSINLTGIPLISDTVDVVVGWNLIGSISEAIQVSNITSVPPGIITSDFFGYRESYFISDTIYPGNAYWVKVNQSGQLILSSSSLVSAASKIRIIPTADVPPSPPSEMVKEVSTIPSDLTLEQNYPNPFNPSTIITFNIPENMDDTRIKLEIYDTKGQLVKTLLNQLLKAGNYSIQWDGTDNRNNILPSGVYFYRLKIGEQVITNKMNLIR